jgi:hypothetical protein
LLPWQHDAAGAFADGQWTLVREDPDFHQRFIAAVEADRIVGRWEASEDFGKTWRKDFDLIFSRSACSREIPSSAAPLGEARARPTYDALGVEIELRLP